MLYEVQIGNGGIKMAGKDMLGLSLWLVEAGAYLHRIKQLSSSGMEERGQTIGVDIKGLSIYVCLTTDQLVRTDN